jgi:hypothetical protein
VSESLQLQMVIYVICICIFFEMLYTFYDLLNFSLGTLIWKRV